MCTTFLQSERALNVPMPPLVAILAGYGILQLDFPARQLVVTANCRRLLAECRALRRACLTLRR